ncbi:hypothetical protein AGMMS49928_29070 [Spirochaetia bacterium]|nr:hypothetical protein AGMMS49928_29070 [Spirochaetia bacterium]
MDKLICSVCIFDTRSFTDNLRYFSKIDDTDFIELIKILCQNGLQLASELDKGNNFYFNSTGDGFITIFFGNNSSIKCYLYSLILSKKNKDECIKFKEKKNREIKFGIGLEFGTVERVEINSSEYKIITYIGDVINITARIEAETKNHFSANIMMGENINKDIVKKLYNIDYDDIVKKVKISNNIKSVTKYLNMLNTINHKMLLTFLSEHILKGVEKQVALFRVSPTLSKRDSPYFHNFIKKCTEHLNIDSTNIYKIIREGETDLIGTAKAPWNVL